MCGYINLIGYLEYGVNMLFTVVVPTFNSAEYIENTLESIDDASESMNYEVIIVDDCSGDIKILKDVLEKYDRVMLIKKEYKTNAADSRNVGYLASKGKYVFFLDSDDSFIKGAIDKRISLHNKTKAGIAFGNFIVKSGAIENKSALPLYHSEDMRDYILMNNGDFRSSVLSICKDYFKNTLFDGESQKHQDWIFAFRCWDNNENIIFDASYSTKIYIDRHSRMSASLNIVASKYLCDKYLDKVEHVNGFSKKNWKRIIINKNLAARSFFFSMYKPKKTSEYMVFLFYKLSASVFVMPLSSFFLCKYREYKVRSDL